MVKKILKVKNIGRYDIDSANEDLSFGRQTVIFGCNKIGKTTLTSIFRSLKENNVSYITSRKTFGSNSNAIPECEILYEDKSKSTFDSNWNNKNIEIFDNEFIQKNIFSGDKIEQNHKTQLHKILIDEENLATQEKIDTFEAEYKILEQSRELIKKEIGLDFDSFVKLKTENKIEDIEIKIKENQNKQKQFNNQVKLNQLKSRTKLSFDFKKFEDNLKQDIDTSLEQKIKDHINNCWNNKNDSVEFLELGVEKISEKNNVCPFCGQSLDNVSDLVSNMRVFFSEAYKQTQQSIKQSIDEFKEIDIDKEIALFKAEGFEFVTPIDAKKMSDNLTSVLLKVDEKLKDLSVDIRIEKLTEYLEYKKVVESMYLETQLLKIEEINASLLYENAKKLNLNKERFSEQGIDKFDRYNKNQEELKNKKSDIDKLNRSLKINLNNLFKKYLAGINDTLASSHANFKLTNLESISNRTMRDAFFCDYSFIFDDVHKVNIVDNESSPQFKNTLSDSDKRIFAFAFFIAKLKEDNLLQNKIVVLDDPFNSLDEDRRDAMITTLSNLGCNQIIILSHSRSFVKRCLLKFNKCIEEDKREIKSLRLSYDPSYKTKLYKLDIELDNDFLEGVEQYLKLLIKANVTTIMSHYDNIRKIIEHIVKTKYGNLLSDEEKQLPMRYFNNTDCISQVKEKIKEDDYQENHHDASDLPTPEELIKKRDDFVKNILPLI